MCVAMCVVYVAYTYVAYVCCYEVIHIVATSHCSRYDIL